MRAPTLSSSAPELPVSAPVLVTGCSSGIGRATVQALLKGPRPVWASARNVETLTELAEAGAHVVAPDVTDEESMVAAVLAVEAVDSDHPRAHYPVGATSRRLMAARGVLPTAWWDAIIRREYPTPRRWSR